MFIFSVSVAALRVRKTLLSEGLKDKKGVLSAFVPFSSHRTVVNNEKLFDDRGNVTEHQTKLQIV